MSTRLPGGRFFADEEIRLLLPMAQTVRAAHIRNGGGTSPLLTICDAIYDDAHGIISVYDVTGKLVGTVGSNDVNLIGGGSAADRLLDGRQVAPIGAGFCDPGEAYLNAPEAASRLGLPVRRVTEMLKQDRVLHGHQQVARGNWLVERAEVERYQSSREAS